MVKINITFLVVQQIVKRQGIEYKIHTLVNLIPDAARLALFAAFARGVDAVDKFQPVFKRAQNQADLNIFRRFFEIISTACATDAFHDIRLFQKDNDLLHIRFGNARFFSKNRQCKGLIFVVIFGKSQTGFQAVTCF